MKKQEKKKDREMFFLYNFVGGDFSNPQVVCSLWGQRTRMALFL